MLPSGRAVRSQSSMELLMTVAFGLIILLPIAILAFIQVSNSSSNLSTSEAQAAASKIANTATAIGAQGYPARQLIVVQVPPNVDNIYVGTPGGTGSTVGHAIVFVVSTNAGQSYVTAYTPVNVTGNLQAITQPGSYLLNVSAQNSCPTNQGVPCVYVSTVQ